jgi:hypothetical protein
LVNNLDTILRANVGVNKPHTMVNYKDYYMQHYKPRQPLLTPIGNTTRQAEMLDRQ